MITGVRGLCNGLGPALYGLIFYLFHVDLNDKGSKTTGTLGLHGLHSNETRIEEHSVLHVSVLGEFLYFTRNIERRYFYFAVGSRSAVCVWIVFSRLCAFSCLLHSGRSFRKSPQIQHPEIFRYVREDDWSVCYHPRPCSGRSVVASWCSNRNPLNRRLVQH